MDRLERVLVVGAGPAGLATAWALKRAGLAGEVDIVEIEADARPAGSGLLLTTPALRVLGALGLQEACVAVGVPFTTWQLFTAQGQPAAQVPLQNVNGPAVPPALGIARVQLHALLMERIGSLGLHVRTRTSVTQLREDAEAVETVFSDGTVQRYDLVIGADGLHSRTRSMILPAAPQPHRTGQMIWRTAFQRGPEHEGYQVFFAGPTRIGLVPITPTSGYVWMLDSTLPAQRPDPASLLAMWRERTAGYGATVRAATEQARRPEQIDYRALRNLIVPLPWHVGRVVLIGDAVHTTTPHLAFGVGLAFEDSFVLAESLRAAATLDEALVRFGQRRFERSRRVVEGAQALGEIDLAPQRATRRAEDIIQENMLALNDPV